MTDIESHGYDETISGLQWSRLAIMLGNHPCVLGSGDWQVKSTAGDRTVALSPGTIYGDGVIDTITTDYTVPQLATVASGSRWDTIYISRDYVACKSTVKVQQGTSAEAPVLPASTATVKNALIGMARVDAGKTQIGAVKQLTMWASRVLYGAPEAIRDRHEGMRYLTPSLDEYIIRDGSATRLYRQITGWRGNVVGVVSGATLDSSSFIIPFWQTDQRGGDIAPSTLDVKPTHVLQLQPGCYTISLYLSTTPFLETGRWQIRSIPGLLDGRVQQLKTADPGGTTLAVIPNAGSATIRLTKTTNIATLLELNSSQNGAMWLGGNYCQITRIGDV